MKKDSNVLNKITYHLAEADKLARKANLGDIFSYSRVKEVLIAEQLGHSINTEYSGADGFDKSNRPCEYKSTVGRRIQATYNGISVQPTWEEQENYLRNKKIGKYPFHYYARFEGTTIAELWKLKAEDVLTILLPKLKKSYETTLSRKDPRLGYTIPTSQIRKYGERLI